MIKTEPPCCPVPGDCLSLLARENLRNVEEQEGEGIWRGHVFQIRPPSDTLTSLIRGEQRRPHRAAASPQGGNKEEAASSRTVIDTDHSSQSDVSSHHPTHTHIHFRQARCRPRRYPHPPPPAPLLPPFAKLPWVADHLGCISTHQWLHLLSAAPRAWRWRGRARKEVLAQLAGHGCSETRSPSC